MSDSEYKELEEMYYYLEGLLNGVGNPLTYYDIVKEVGVSGNKLIGFFSDKMASYDFYYPLAYKYLNGLITMLYSKFKSIRYLTISFLHRMFKLIKVKKVYAIEITNTVLNVINDDTDIEEHHIIVRMLRNCIWFHSRFGRKKLLEMTAEYFNSCLLTEPKIPNNPIYHKSGTGYRFTILYLYWRFQRKKIYEYLDVPHLRYEIIRRDLIKLSNRDIDKLILQYNDPKLIQNLLQKKIQHGKIKVSENIMNKIVALRMTDNDNNRREFFKRTLNVLQIK